MSLINEVLRDLDSRHAADSERMGLAHQVRALPPVAVPWWKKATLPVVAAILGGAAVWFLLPQQATTSPAAPAAAPSAPAIAEARPPETAMPAEPVVTAPPAATPVVENPPLKLDVEMGKAPVQPPVTKRAAKADEPGKDAVKELSKEPAKVAASREAGKPTPTSSPVAPAESATKTISVPSANPKAAAPSNPQISKQISGGGTLNEQAEADYQRGLAALRRGAASDAGEAFRAALKLQANHAPARHALLAQLVEQRQWQAVEVVALDGLVSLPARHDWALLAARVQFERGDVSQALDTMTTYASYARKSADYQIFHALLLQRANRPAEAVVCYQAALAINPGEGRWWYGLARALESDQREAEARQAYEKARASGNLPSDLAAAVERRLR